MYRIIWETDKKFIQNTFRYTTLLAGSQLFKLEMMGFVLFFLMVFSGGLGKDRSSGLQMFFKIGVKNFAIFRGTYY